MFIVWVKDNDEVPLTWLCPYIPVYVSLTMSINGSFDYTVSTNERAAEFSTSKNIMLKYNVIVRKKMKMRLNAKQETFNVRFHHAFN